MPRAANALDPPEGLVFAREFLADDEARALLDAIERLEFRPIVIRGVPARRTARHYGLDYDYERREHLVERAEPVPAWLLPLRARCGALAGVEGDAFVEALVQRYPVGATIGWHRDAPLFGVVVGVSLLGACRLRFRRGRTGAWQTWETVALPGSAYVLAGPARTVWQHAIPPTRALRYSVTFRTLRR